MENSNKGFAANPTHEPTQPMTHSTGGNYNQGQYNRPFQQPQEVSAVTETSEPESGWKGMLHKFASKLSDSQYAFWLPLLFANRAKMAEGTSDVLQKGSISNLLEETGLKHEWEHNRKSLVTKVAVSTAVAAGVFALVRWNNHRKHNQI